MLFQQRWKREVRRDEGDMEFVHEEQCVLIISYQIKKNINIAGRWEKNPELFVIYKGLDDRLNQCFKAK